MLLKIKYLLKFIHGERLTVLNFFSIHVLPFTLAWLNVEFNKNIFANFSSIQMVFYYLIAWELGGGIVANLTSSTKQFWSTQPIKNKLIYIFLHAWHPIAWLLFFSVDIRFGIVYFLYMSLSTIVLLKISKRVLLPLSILFTFGGILLSYKIGELYSPFPFGFEWVPTLFFLKLIFAFTVKYKK